MARPRPQWQIQPRTEGFISMKPKLAQTGSDYIARNGGLTPPEVSGMIGGVSGFYDLQNKESQHDTLQREAQTQQMAGGKGFQGSKFTAQDLTIMNEAERDKRNTFAPQPVAPVAQGLSNGNALPQNVQRTKQSGVLELKNGQGFSVGGDMYAGNPSEQAQPLINKSVNQITEGLNATSVDETIPSNRRGFPQLGTPTNENPTNPVLEAQQQASTYNGMSTQGQNIGQAVPMPQQQQGRMFADAGQAPAQGQQGFTNRFGRTVEPRAGGGGYEKAQPYDAEQRGLSRAMRADPKFAYQVKDNERAFNTNEGRYQQGRVDAQKSAEATAANKNAEIQREDARNATVDQAKIDAAALSETNAIKARDEQRLFDIKTKEEDKKEALAEKHNGQMGRWAALEGRKNKDGSPYLTDNDYQILERMKGNPSAMNNYLDGVKERNSEIKEPTTITNIDGVKVKEGGGTIVKEPTSNANYTAAQSATRADELQLRISKPDFKTLPPMEQARLEQELIRHRNNSNFKAGGSQQSAPAAPAATPAPASNVYDAQTERLNRK